MSRIADRGPATLRVASRLSRADLLWVANTAHGPGGHWHARVRGSEPDHDHLADPESARRYLADHGLTLPPGLPDAADLRELATIRAMVQRMVSGDDAWTDAGTALLREASFALDAGQRLVSTTTGWPGFCRDLLVPLVALAGEPGRLRRCANPACRLVFEDGSRNHGRRWCDTAGCGNRDRVRRARTRSAPARAARAPVPPARA